MYNISVAIHSYFLYFIIGSSNFDYFDIFDKCLFQVTNFQTVGTKLRIARRTYHIYRFESIYFEIVEQFHPDKEEYIYI